MDSPRDLLRRRGLHPKKSWGQNFLGDPNLLGRIAEATRAGPGDLVVELGAGLGHLTQALLSLGADVIAVEREREVAAALKVELGDSTRLRILEANAATLDLSTLSEAPVTVVGNLPYQLSSAILFRMLEQRAHLKRLVFLLQAEFVERLAAVPGGRDYGVLSIQAQAVASVTALFRIPAGAFYPRPSVDSAVVELVPLERPRVSETLAPLFSAVVRGSFQHRRKTLANALDQAGFEQGRAALERVNIAPERRAETLTIEDFAALAAAFASLKAEPSPG